MACRVDPLPDFPRPAGALPAQLEWVADGLDHLRQRDLVRPRRTRHGRQGREVVVDGHRLVNFGANDYLGYAGDVRLTRAAARTACAEGFGAGASPLVSGRSASHAALERALARLLDADEALLFGSGFAANAATIAALVGPGDTIASDARNHASIIDGCRLSRATVSVYPHRDVAALARLLAAAPPGRRLIVTDSLFSMDGTIAPLADLCTVAERSGAMLLVDEAHATGVFGARGSGLVEAAGCADGVHVRVGTLSKALGAAGGFVAGHRLLVRWLEHSARAWVFSTAHPPPVVGAALRAVELLSEEPQRRGELVAGATALRARLDAAGVVVGGDATPILPVIVGNAAAAVERSARLAAAGLFVPAIRPPSVPEGESVLRVSLSWSHSPDDLDRLVAALTVG